MSLNVFTFLRRMAIMAEQRTISVSKDTFDRLKSEKRDGETWNAFMNRRILDDGELNVDTFTLDDEQSIKIANRVLEHVSHEQVAESLARQLQSANY